MEIIRDYNLEDWTTGCVVMYDSRYCLVVENDLSDKKYALLYIETNSIVAEFDEIESLENIEIIASDTSVRICF